MALLTLLSKRPIRTRLKASSENKSADILLIDIVDSETVDFENEVTDHPIEDGSEISDHIRKKPIAINIQGTISETPLTITDDSNDILSAGEAEAKGLARGFLGGAIAAASAKVAGQFGSLAGAAGGVLGAQLMRSDDNPAQIARKKLIDLLKSGERFTVQTKYEAYNNMVIKKLSFPRSNADGRSLKFSAEFKQINIVTGKEVKIKSLARSAAGGAAAKTNLGAQSANAASPATQGSASLLKTFIGGR